MSYDPNIPLATDFISDSQSQIKTNFTQLNTQFGEDHVALITGTNAGMHDRVRTPERAAIPVASAGLPVIYSFEDAPRGAVKGPGVLQYSRCEVDQVPTPISALHGSTPGYVGGAMSGIEVFDCATLPYAIIDFYATLTGGVSLNVRGTAFWDGTSYINGTTDFNNQIGSQTNNFRFEISATTKMIVINSGTIASSTLNWSVFPRRLQVT